MRESQIIARVMSLVIMSAFCFGCASISPPVVCDLSPTAHPSLPERGISAHRGGFFGCPMNTIGAFQRAICSGVHQIEFDVRATTDGALVVAHDDHVTDAFGKTLTISDSRLSDIQQLRLAPCAGEETGERIPTLEEALAVMPQNIWLNIDMKENDPLLARLVAETVAKSDRFHQVIFSARKDADLAARRVAQNAGARSWIGNMSRQIFRSQYVESTINSCDPFIQLTFLRGKPDQTTMERLKGAGIRVNYSWLRGENTQELEEDLDKLFTSHVDFVLVDYAEPAMKAACALGIKPVIPLLDGRHPSYCSVRPSCP